MRRRIADLQERVEDFIRGQVALGKRREKRHIRATTALARDATATAVRFQPEDVTHEENFRRFREAHAEMAKRL